MFRRSKLSWTNAAALARFLNDVRNDSPWLSSRGFMRDRAEAAAVVETEKALMEAESASGRLGTFVLHNDDRIVACVQVDDRQDDGRVAVFSNAETHPYYQRRGTFWRHLGIPCIRAFARGSFDRLEALTWTYNRKGIPVYKRFGFRAVPGTSLLLENYLPSIVKHPATAAFFGRHDFLRYLANERSYGYDSCDRDGLRLFSYRWERAGETLEVLVDWERRQVICIDRDDWCIWCYTLQADPFIVHYRLANKGDRSVVYCLHKRNGGSETTRLQPILPNTVGEGDIHLGGGHAEATVTFELAGERVPFRMRRRPARRAQQAGAVRDAAAREQRA